MAIAAVNHIIPNEQQWFVHTQGLIDIVTPVDVYGYFKGSIFKLENEAGSAVMPQFMVSIDEEFTLEWIEGPTRNNIFNFSAVATAIREEFGLSDENIFDLDVDSNGRAYNTPWKRGDRIASTIEFNADPRGAAVAEVPAAAANNIFAFAVNAQGEGGAQGSTVESIFALDVVATAEVTTERELARATINFDVTITDVVLDALAGVQVRAGVEALIEFKSQVPAIINEIQELASGASFLAEQPFTFQIEFNGATTTTSIDDDVDADILLTVLINEIPAFKDPFTGLANIQYRDNVLPGDPIFPGKVEFEFVNQLAGLPMPALLTVVSQPASVPLTTAVILDGLAYVNPIP